MNYNILLKLASKFESLIAQTEGWINPEEWKSDMEPEEKLLLNNNFKPIGRINYRGAYSSFLGQGAFSSVWEIEYQGKRAVAKVTDSFTDMQNYKRIMEIAKSASEEIKKHLPVVYEITETKDERNKIYYIIITEFLNPLNSHVKNTLFTSTSDPTKSKYKVPEIEDFKNLISNNFSDLSDIVLSSFKIETLNKDKKWTDNFDPEIMKALAHHKDEIIDACANFLYYDFKKQFTAAENNKNKLLKIIEEIFINRLGKDYNKYTDDTESGDIKSEESESAKEKYWPESSINSDYWKDFRTLGQKITKDLLVFVFSKFDFKFPYSHDTLNVKERIDYYQHLPETQSLITALQSLKDDFFFSWDDLGPNNLMERPSTKDIVISDPGTFQ